MPENDINLHSGQDEPAPAPIALTEDGEAPDSVTVDSSDGPSVEAEPSAQSSEEHDPTSEDVHQLSLSIPEPEKSDSDEDSEDTAEEDEGSHSIFGAAPPYDPEKPRKADVRFDFIELLILTLTVVFVLTTFVFRHSIVDGESMLNTLHDRDALIISDLFYTPEQYDVVVIEDHSTGLDHPLVKRIIAVGGDTVKVTADTIYVNGEAVRDDFVYIDYCKGKDYEIYTPTSFVVPEGELYVLGDHRCDSLDSRAFGTVSVDAVIGKVLFRFYPFSDFGPLYTEED